jgi:hypothetical protein
MTISLFNAERLNYGRPFTITIGGKEYKGTFFEDCRISEIYKNAHAYGIRHSDEDLCEPVSVAKGYPMVNFFGTFITKKPLPIERETDIDSWSEE